MASPIFVASQMVHAQRTRNDGNRFRPLNGLYRSTTQVPRGSVRLRDRSLQPPQIPVVRRQTTYLSSAPTMSAENASEPPDVSTERPFALTKTVEKSSCCEMF